MSVDDLFLAQLEASREPDDRLGECWLTFHVRCSNSREEGHPEETDLVIEDVYDINLGTADLLETTAWVSTADGWLCPHCASLL